MEIGYNELPGLAEIQSPAISLRHSQTDCETETVASGFRSSGGLLAVERFKKAISSQRYAFRQLIFDLQSG